MSNIRIQLRHYWLPAILLLLFLMLAGLRLHQPLGQDELSHYYKLSWLLFHHGFQNPENLITFSPHAYPLWVVACCRLVGVFNPLVVKVAGVLLWLFCLLLMTHICRRLAQMPFAGGASEPAAATTPSGRMSPRAPIIGLLLCVTMPAAIQASVTLDIDQAALPLLVLLLCVAAERWCHLPSWRASICLILAFALALWGRITTPALLTPVLLLHAALVAKKGLRWRNIWRLAALLAAGALLFLLTWSLYCWLTGIDQTGVFRYFSRSLQETTIGERSSDIQKLLQNLAALLFWGCNPFFLAALAIVACQRLKAWWHCQQLQPADVYWLSATAIFGGYLIVGGALFGFPKYHSPAIPLLIISLVPTLQSAVNNQHARKGWLALTLAAGSALLAMLLLPDPIYVWRVTMRVAQLKAQPLRPILLNLGLRMAGIYGFCGAAVLLCAWRRKLPLFVALLAAGLGVNLALLAAQATAGYSTGYMYGESGEIKQVTQLIQERHLEKYPLLVPVEFVQNLGWLDVRVPELSLWDDPQLLAQRIRQEKPALVAMSVLISPVPILRRLLDDQELRQSLDENYVARHTGKMRLWIRRDLQEQ